MFTEYLTLKKYTTNTREGILKTVRRFIEWTETENVPLLSVSYNDMSAYVADRKKTGVKPVSIQREILNVKHYYTFLLSIDQVSDNPCSNIEIHGIKRKMLYETFSPEELENIYRSFANKTTSVNGIGSALAHKRNKIMLGLIIYQGLRTEEIGGLRTSDVDLREGKIKIEGGRRTEGREMKIEAHQLYEMIDYMNETRKLLIAISGKPTDKVFINMGGSESIGNVMQKILNAIRKIDPRIKEIKQIRASVITNWLKVHNIRKVQYMAGHRYVSSTESYQANNMDDLKEDVNRYHPNL